MKYPNQTRRWSAVVTVAFAMIAAGAGFTLVGLLWPVSYWGGLALAIGVGLGIGAARVLWQRWFNV